MFERLRTPVAMSLATAAAVGAAACTPKPNHAPEPTPNAGIEDCRGLPPYVPTGKHSKEGSIFTPAPEVNCKTPLYHPDTQQWTGDLLPGEEFIPCAFDDAPLRFGIVLVKSNVSGFDGIANLSSEAANQWKERQDVPLCDSVR